MSKIINETGIHPRGKWVLVKPMDVNTETSNGLVIPESVEKEQKAKGEVLEVGDEVTKLNVGDLVLYGKYAGEEIQLKDKHEQKDKVDLILLLDEDVLATMDK